MNKQKIFLSLFLIFLTAFLSAELLEWENAREITISNNYTLQTAREKVKEAKLKETIANSRRLPQIDSSLSAQKSGSATDKSDTGPFDKENIRDSQSLSISGRQLIFDGAKTKYNLAAAQTALKETELAYLVSESNVRLNLRRNFCNLQQAQELLTLSQEIAQRRQQQYELVKLRYEAGLEHRGSLLTAEANLAKALLDIKQATRAIDFNQRTLANTMGITINSQLTTTGDLSVKTIVLEIPDFQKLLATTPFLQELALQIDQARYNLGVAKAAYLPQVYGNGSLSKGFNQTNDNSTESDNWSLGVNLSYPLFDGANRKATKESAEIQLHQAKINEKNTSNSLLLTLQETWLNLLNRIDDIDLQEKYLAAASARSTIAEAQYSSGLITFDNWTIIEDALVSTQKSYLNARINALLAESNWIQAKGGTLNEI